MSDKKQQPQPQPLTKVMQVVIWTILATVLCFGVLNVALPVEDNSEQPASQQFESSQDSEFGNW